MFVRVKISPRSPRNRKAKNTKNEQLILLGLTQLQKPEKTKNKMKPTNPNAHTYGNGTDVKTHGYAVTHKTFLQ